MNRLNFNLSVLVRVSCGLLCKSAEAGGSVATVSEADVNEKIVCTENGLCSIFSIINGKQQIDCNAGVLISHYPFLYKVCNYNY